MKAQPVLPPEEEGWEVVSSWGRTREMSPLEAAMWRAEADPRLRSAITALYLLDCVPDWERLVAAHEWATRLVPRFRKRVVDPPLHLGAPTYVTDPDFDLAHHLRRVALPAPGGPGVSPEIPGGPGVSPEIPGTMGQVLEVAEGLAMTPFDRARPPWEAVLVEGLEEGRAAYLLKLHHSVTDGQGGIQLLMLLHSRRREPTPDKPTPEPPGPERADPFSLLGAQLTRRTLDAPGRLGRTLARVVGEAGRLASAPAEVLSEAVAFSRSLQRVLTPPPVPPSPLLAGRSLAYRFGVAEVGLGELRAAGRAAGGTLGDAFVAALLGGFRRYHQHFGVELDELPIALPISLRRHDHPMGGNRFAGARFAAPVGEPDPAERIRLVYDFVLTARAEPALDALGLLAPVLAHLPTPLLARFYLSQSTRLDLQASNVAGITEPVYMAGARIERMYPLGPLPGCAVMAALVSHVGTCCVGINCDPAAVREPDLFFDCVREGFAEVLGTRALIGSSST